MNPEIEYRVPKGAVEAQDYALATPRKNDGVIPSIAGTRNQSAKQRALIQADADELDRMNREARARLLGEPLDFVMPIEVHDGVMFHEEAEDLKTPDTRIEPEPEPQPPVRTGQASKRASPALLALVKGEGRPFGWASAFETVAAISHHQAFSLCKGQPVYLSPADEERVINAINYGWVDSEWVRRKALSQTGKSRAGRAVRVNSPVARQLKVLPTPVPVDLPKTDLSDRVDRIEGLLVDLELLLKAFMEGKA